MRHAVIEIYLFVGCIAKHDFFRHLGYVAGQLRAAGRLRPAAPPLWASRQNTMVRGNSELLFPLAPLPHAKSWGKGLTAGRQMTPGVDRFKKVA